MYIETLYNVIKKFQQEDCRQKQTEQDKVPLQLAMLMVTVLFSYSGLFSNSYRLHDIFVAHIVNHLLNRHITLRNTFAVRLFLSQNLLDIDIPLFFCIIHKV